jgi:hypothetical protein
MRSEEEMRSRSVVAAIAVSILCAGTGAYCYWRGAQARSEAEWARVRGAAEDQEFTTTLDSAAAERQLASVDRRRELLERAAGWRRYLLLSVVGSLGAALGAYLLFLISRLREQISDASPPP